MSYRNFLNWHTIIYHHHSNTTRRVYYNSLRRPSYYSPLNITIHHKTTKSQVDSSSSSDLKINSVETKEEGQDKSYEEPLVILPPVPEPPPPELCCMSGCATCVLDLYQDELDLYQAAKAKLRAQLTERNLPLPDELKTPDIKSDPALDAFNALEKALQNRSK